MQLPLSLPHFAPRTVRGALILAAARRAALPFALSRLGLLVATLIAGGGALDLTRWYFWDGANYTAIAAVGYPVDHPERLAFFPLFSLLQRLAAFGDPRAAFFAGLVLANACCFGACVLLELLAPARRCGPPASALLLAWPSAFFLAAPYTESLFLLLTCGLFLALRREAWGWALLCCALATATRPVGLALLLPLSYAYLHARGVSWASCARLAGMLAIGCAGLFAFSAYCLVAIGDPLAWAHAESVYFGHALAWPWQTTTLAATAFAAHPSPALFADAGGLALTLALFAAVARRMPISHALFAAAVLLPALIAPMPGEHADPLASAGRYALAALPALLPALLAAGRRHPRLTWALLSTGAAAQVGLALIELRHGWLP